MATDRNCAVGRQSALVKKKKCMKCKCVWQKNFILLMNKVEKQYITVILQQNQEYNIIANWSQKDTDVEQMYI